MRLAVKHDMRLEERHWDPICSILGRVFFKKNIEKDLHQGTDMYVASINGRLNIGCRLRTNEYIKKYQCEMTIRFSRPSGIETEWHKLRSGFFDYIFYGFVSFDESKIVQWIIVDCKKMIELDPRYKGPYKNNPPDSELIAFRLKDIHQAIIKYFPSFMEKLCTTY